MPDHDDSEIEPTPPDDEPAIPVPPDPVDPLRRDSDDDDEGHPGVDPVTRPIPPG